jgi:hypothetical protein
MSHLVAQQKPKIFNGFQRRQFTPCDMVATWRAVAAHATVVLHTRNARALFTPAGAGHFTTVMKWGH